MKPPHNHIMIKVSHHSEGIEYKQSVRKMAIPHQTLRNNPHISTQSLTRMICDAMHSTNITCNDFKETRKENDTFIKISLHHTKNGCEVRQDLRQLRITNLVPTDQITDIITNKLTQQYVRFYIYNHGVPRLNQQEYKPPPAEKQIAFTIQRTKEKRIKRTVGTIFTAYTVCVQCASPLKPVQRNILRCYICGIAGLVDNYALACPDCHMTGYVRCRRCGNEFQYPRQAVEKSALLGVYACTHDGCKFSTKIPALMEIHLKHHHNKA